MSDTFITIFSSLSIVSIILTCSYTLMDLNRRKQSGVKILAGFYDWCYHRLVHGRIAASNLNYTWGYLIDLALIPIMMFIALILINQLGIGELRVRPDMQSFLGMAFWILLLLNKISKKK